MNMGNALEAEYEGAWGYSIRQEDLWRIKQAGFDTIRLPVRWDTHAAHHAPYGIQRHYMVRVRAVVDQAHAYGLGVILDVHHYLPLYENTEKELPRFVAIWEQIAREFQHVSGPLYFEPINEPFPYGSIDEVNRLYAAVIPVIRRYHPKKYIILGGNQWNSFESLAGVAWPSDPYIVATFHDYVPHDFTHQGNSWESNPPPVGRRWGRRSDHRDLQSLYKQARAFQAKTGLHIFVGEFGVIDTVPDSERAAWTQARREMMEASGMSWCYWSFSGPFALYDTTAERWNGPILNALIPFAPQR